MMKTGRNEGPCGGRPSLSDEVKAFAEGLGFEPVGITTAEPAEEAESRLQQWRRAGHAASMDYMLRERPRRTHPQDLLPEARSVVCLAFNYYPGEAEGEGRERAHGRVARYAVGLDYHTVLKKKLRRLEAFMVELGTAETQTKTLVDSGPLLEREFARRAGVGFIGKNTHLIALKHGSWVFLAEVLTSLELEPDRPISANCGTCTECLKACPTGALREPFVLDARRCISYWTIEHRGLIAEEPELNAWVFGCDLCQEVCPFNHKPAVSTERQFRQGTIVETELPLVELLRLDSDDAFRLRLKRSPLLRPKREGIVRNALRAATNQGAKDLLPWIENIASSDSSAELRQLARHAVQVLGGLPQGQGGK